MLLTQEQIDIVQSTGDIKINAVAGSGKTTTIIEYAKARPATAKILYLAFNKSVKLEAIRKFADKGLSNVTVETAHSLAFRYVVMNSKYKIRSQGYQTHEIASILRLDVSGEKHTQYILANHINKFLAYFCNSDRAKVQQLSYLDVVTDGKARAFVVANYAYIEHQTRVLLSMMDKGEIEITHDFYLKKFQLNSPVLPYQYILFDEGQDASPAMLDVFLKQKAIKVIVGDTHQQIYGWRFAVNSLEKADFKTYQLSTSFRFGQSIANLAVDVLKWKYHLAEHQPLTIIGKGDCKEHKVKAVIARTNLSLLLKAIEYVVENKKLKHIYFEGNINSYTYADEGASLYDVLNLYNNHRHLIRDALIKQMKDIDELEDYIEKTDDAQLSMMLEIVKEYGDDIPYIIKTIKEKHVPNDQRDKAEMIFSTVHRCKGMEYDSVQLVKDFITEDKLLDKLEESQDEGGDVSEAKLREEINLLYVAVTRTKNSLYIPESLMPKGWTHSPNIHILHSVKESEYSVDDGSDAELIDSVSEKSYNVTTIRQTNKEAYSPWTQEMDDELTVMFCEGVNVKDLSAHFGRTKGAIESRIKKLELRDLYPD